MQYWTFSRRHFYNNSTLLDFNLGSRLSYIIQVCSVFPRYFYFLRKICFIRDTVGRKPLFVLVWEMILSCLVYCNSLYYGLPANSIQKLRRLMNSAYHLNFRLPPGSKTANFIKQLHWLPIKQRVFYKIVLFRHRLVHNPQKILVYLGTLVFFVFFVVLYEWIILPFEM